MYIKNIQLAVFLCFLVWGQVSFADEKPPKTSARSVIVIDADTETVIYEKNADEKLYPASITKILTGYLGIVKGGDLEQKITVSRKAAYGITPGSSSISLKPNEIFPLKDVLYGLMLRSANECGNVIAEHVSGSNSAFADLMNQTVKEWGLENSHFVNPHGLHNSKHKSTARDMAIIAKHAMENLIFKDIVATRYHAFPDTNKHKGVERGKMTNKNKMLHPHNDTYYAPCIGIKAGYTKNSLHTFVAEAEKDGHRVIVVQLRETNKENMYKTLVSLMEYGLSQFKKKSLASKGTFILDKKFKRSSGKLDIIAGETLRLSLPQQCSNIEKKIDLNELELPVHEGDIVGSISFHIKDIQLGSVPLIAMNTVVSKFSWQYMKGIIFSAPVLTTVALLIGLILFALGNKKKVNRRVYYR